jgi:hypothetical protein
VKLASRISEAIAEERRIANREFDARSRIAAERRVAAADRTAAVVEHAGELVTGLRLLSVGASLAFTIFTRAWEQTFAELRRVCSQFQSVHAVALDDQKQKCARKVLAKDQEIRRLNSEIQVLKKSRAEARQKIRALSAASPKKKRIVKLVSPAFEALPPVETVSIGTQSGLINMTLIRDRTIRHSKEAELSVLQAELERSKAQNAKMLEQIGGLHKMVRRAGESATEESSKVRQTIDDLEMQLREEKRNHQRSNAKCLKLQRDSEELAHAASKVDPLKKCLVSLFKRLQQRLEPLIAEQAIPDDLTELDELAQEIFQVPIHKICNQTFSRAFLKKQERKLGNALSEGIEINEIEGVFDAVFDELQKRSRNARHNLA